MNTKFILTLKIITRTIKNIFKIIFILFNQTRMEWKCYFEFFFIFKTPIFYFTTNFVFKCSISAFFFRSESTGTARCSPPARNRLESPLPFSPPAKPSTPPRVHSASTLAASGRPFCSLQLPAGLTCLQVSFLEMSNASCTPSQRILWQNAWRKS